MNDLRFAFRQLLKNPGFTAVAVLTLALSIESYTAGAASNRVTLALGIGANTAINGSIPTSAIQAGKAMGEFCLEPSA